MKKYAEALCLIRQKEPRNLDYRYKLTACTPYPIMMV
jgi:hypothetical protein